MNTGQPSEKLARDIIQRMGEVGQPPERGALEVNVGTGDILETLREEYLRPMREMDRISSFKLVQAPFGGGKSQFLRCLREISWGENFVVSLSGVSARECPFDDQVKVYSSVVRNLEAPPPDPETTPEKGFDAVIRHAVESRRTKYSGADLKTWIHETIGRVPAESRALQRAVVGFMVAVLERNHNDQTLLGDWLRAEDVSRSEVSRWQIREELEAATAFRFLKTMVQMIRAMNYGGAVLLFDEMDRTMSFSPARKKAVCENLRQTIDACGTAELPSALVVYAVPPEFMLNIVPTYAALAQRLHFSGAFTQATPLSPLIDLDHLKLTHQQLFDALGKRILDIFNCAYTNLMDRTLQQANLSRLAALMARNVLESGTRRSFVKAAIRLLSGQLREGQKLADDTMLRGLISDASREQPGALPGEETFQ